MGTIAFALRAQSRLRWRSWLAVVVLLSIIGGFVLASVAAGRRTDAAFPQFVAKHGFDAAVYAQRSVPAVIRLPDVAASATITGPISGQPVCHCSHAINPANLSVEFIASRHGSPWRLVAGRLPDPTRPDEVLASFTLQQQNDVQVGTIIHVPFFATSQASLLDGGGAAPQPAGPIATLRVVGIEASVIDFPAGSTPLDELLVTRAFRLTVMRHTANSVGYAVRLKGGASELSRFEAEVNALKTPAGVANEDGEFRSVEASIHGQAVGWWILALIAAIVGAAVLYQSLARQAVVERPDYSTMTALGASRRQLVLLGMARHGLVAGVGAVGAILVAVALSPLAPLGEARLAETSSGLTFDELVLPVGALIIVVAILVLGLWPVWQSSRTARTRADSREIRPSAVVARLAAIGAPPSILIGTRHALQARLDGARVAVSPAIMGTVLAVAALCGTVVFGSSLSHLTATPALYGDTYQLDFGTGQADPSLLRTLEHDPAITDISRGSGVEVTVNGKSVGALVTKAIRGRLLVSTTIGQLPAAHQIALGATTMREVGAHVGSVVRVAVPSSSREKRTVPLRVVAQVALPVLDGGTSLGTGAVFSTEGFKEAACPPGPTEARCRTAIERGGGGIGILAAAVPGQRGRAAVTHYLDAYPSIAEPAVAPTSLVNFGESVNFPFIVAGIVAAFGAATLIHLLIISVARRRRETALLRVLGFVNRQVVSTVAWQATTIALIGTAVGVPLGIVLGRTIWLAFASHLGVVPVAVVNIPVVAALVISILIVANLLAIVPALAAQRIDPGRSLRAP